MKIKKFNESTSSDLTTIKDTYFESSVYVIISSDEKWIMSNEIERYAHVEPTGTYIHPVKSINDLAKYSFANLHSAQEHMSDAEEAGGVFIANFHSQLLPEHQVDKNTKEAVYEGFKVSGMNFKFEQYYAGYSREINAHDLSKGQV